MALTIEEICADVLKKISPNTELRKSVLELAQQLTKNVEESAKKMGITAKVRVEGSVAKDTWLNEEPEIDIFMRVPTTVPREAFGTVCLDIARKAAEGFKQVERFAEHPYLEAVVNGVRVNIVPCYAVKQGEWMSATDRTPFHTDYVKPLFNERLKAEVRLLKRFMKGIGVYGAEIKIGGFSGYLCELLTLNFGSFVRVLESISSWNKRIIVDYAGFYKERRAEIDKIFEDPFVVIDPVDKGRNVAAAVRRERLYEFIVASRLFLENPQMSFFYADETEAMSLEAVIHALRNRRSVLVLIKFGRVEAVSDIMWGQLYKTQKSLRNMLRQEDFTVIRDSVLSTEALNLFLFEVQHRFLPFVKKHLGPPIEKRLECKRFLQKHNEASHTIFGPCIEDGRLMVGIRRKYADAVELFREKLSDGGRGFGVGDLISKSIKEGFEILSNEEILELYSSNPEFAKFLTEYLQGKPCWLE